MASSHNAAHTLSKSSPSKPPAPSQLQTRRSSLHHAAMILSLDDRDTEMQDHKEGHCLPKRTESERSTFGTEAGITLSSSSRHAGRTVAPFLAQHIPEQYAPQGQPLAPAEGESDPDTKYCYRHRPDLKCRRQADEPSMEQLQSVSELILG